MLATAATQLAQLHQRPAESAAIETTLSDPLADNFNPDGADAAGRVEFQR
jgi:hypothetical protein